MIDWDTFKAQLQANPGKALKSVLLLAGFLLLIWLLVVVQTDPVTQNRVKVQPSGQLDGFSVGTIDVKDSLTVGTAQNEGAIFSEKSTQENMVGLFPAVLIVLVMVGGAWLWMRSQKTKKEQKIDGKIYSTIATQPLPGGQQLMVAKLNEEYWVMAMGGHKGVVLLHRYNAEDWQGINRPSAKNSWKSTLLKTLNSTEVKKN